MTHPLSGLRTDARFVLNALQDQHLRKHLLWWLRSKQKDYLLNNACPWLAFDAILALRARMRPGMRVFEFGSGGSTLFWLANQAAQVVSVEHDPAWYGVVSERVRGQSAVDLRLILPETVDLPDHPYDPADPQLYQSDDEGFRRHSFQKYVSQIDAFPDGYFDVLLVDGRARPSCIAHSAAKVKEGGMLILDNAERSYYLDKTQQHLHSFAGRFFTGIGPINPSVWTTALFVRQSL